MKHCRFPDLASHAPGSHDPSLDNLFGSQTVPDACDVEPDFTPVFQRVSITGDEDTGGVNQHFCFLESCASAIKGYTSKTTYRFNCEGEMTQRRAELCTSKRFVLFLPSLKNCASDLTANDNLRDRQALVLTYVILALAFYCLLVRICWVRSC